MGLISKIKGLFRKEEISVDEKSGNKLITIANPSGIIKVGQSLVVNEGFVAVIVAKGKVCDIYSKGEYKLETGYMQKASKVRKLAKADKNGNFKKKFKGIIYFVNLREFENLDFESYNGINVKEKKLFSTYVLMYGKFSCKIFNPQKFLNILIKEYYNINDEITTKQLALWVGECVDKFVDNKKLTFKYFYLKDIKTISDGLFEYAKKMFQDIGVEICAINLEKVEYDKRLNRKIEQGKLFIDDIVVAPEIPQETKEKEQALKEIVENEDNQNIISDLDIEKTSNSELEEYRQTVYEEIGIPYEDNEFDKKNIDINEQENIKNGIESKKQENIEDKEFEFDFSTDITDIENVSNINEDNKENQIYSNELKFDFEKDIEEKQSNILENDDDIIIGQSVKYKPCESCGAKNTISASSCYNCGSKFKKVCNICGAEMEEDSYVCPKCKAVNI